MPKKSNKTVRQEIDTRSLIKIIFKGQANFFGPKDEKRKTFNNL